MAVTKKIPQRQCVGCGENNEKRNMIRIIKNNEGEIFLDETGKKNGRGAYICKKTECLQKSIKNKGLERSLKVQIPEDIYECLKMELDKLSSVSNGGEA